MFFASFLAFAITATAQDSPLNNETPEEAAAKKAEQLTKVPGCVEYKVDTEGGFICTKRADVVEVRGDNERDVIAITRDELNAMIDARINGRKESHDRNLNEAVGEYFYGPEMAKVFAGAEELRKKGLDAEAERVVRKAIGRDPDLRAAWEAYKKGKRQTATRVRNLNNMLGETQLTGCTADTIPSFIDKSVADAFWFNVRVVFITQNLTGSSVRIRDERGKIVVNGLCPGGVMSIHRHLDTFFDGTWANYRFTAEVVRPDGTIYLSESPVVSLQTFQLNFGRQQTLTWKIEDPEKGMHPARRPTVQRGNEADDPESSTSDPAIEEPVIRESVPGGALTVPEPPGMPRMPGQR